MKKLTRFLINFLIILLLIVSCTESKETKILIFNENHKNILEDLILYKKYNMEIIEKDNFWMIKNINEEALLELIGIARLKMDVIANNIANVNTENYVRKYVKITVENGVEIVNDTESVDLTKETVDMIEIQRLYEASIEYLIKVNKNIIIM
jgi:hypothetical protein